MRYQVFINGRAVGFSAEFQGDSPELFIDAKFKLNDHFRSVPLVLIAWDAQGKVAYYDVALPRTILISWEPRAARRTVFPIKEGAN